MIKQNFQGTYKAIFTWCGSFLEDRHPLQGRIPQMEHEYLLACSKWVEKTVHQAVLDRTWWCWQPLSKMLKHLKFIDLMTNMVQWLNKPERIGFYNYKKCSLTIIVPGIMSTSFITGTVINFLKNPKWLEIPSQYIK